MPWKRDIFTAISLEMLGSRRSSVRRRRLWGDTHGSGGSGRGAGSAPISFRGVWPEPGRGAPQSGARGQPVPYRDVLLQPSLGEDPVEPWPQRPLGQDGKHDALQHQRVHALQTPAVSPHCPPAPRETWGSGQSGAAGGGGVRCHVGGRGLCSHLQDGPIDTQQDLPWLISHAEDVLRQRTLEEQVAEPPAVGMGWSEGAQRGRGATGAPGVRAWPGEGQGHREDWQAAGPVAAGQWGRVLEPQSGGATSRRTGTLTGGELGDTRGTQAGTPVRGATEAPGGEEGHQLGGNWMTLGRNWDNGQEATGTLVRGGSCGTMGEDWATRQGDTRGPLREGLGYRSGGWQLGDTGTAGGRRLRHQSGGQRKHQRRGVRATRGNGQGRS